MHCQYSLSECSHISKLILLLLVLSTPVPANRISESIYEDLDATYSCFKITNASHQIGCQGDFSGNVGVVAVANSTADLTSLLTSEDLEPVVVVLPRALFTVSTLQQLEVMSADSNRADVKGVVLALDNDWSPDTVRFSEDESCPNQMSSLYRGDDVPAQYRDYCSKQPWNPDGTAMFRRHWTFPVILLTNQTQISYLYDCHRRFNAGSQAWPRCAAEMRTFMSAAGNSEICWRRTQSQYINTKASVYCMPMGSLNVFSTVKPLQEKEPVIVLAARADGFTMFDALAPSADAAAVGLVALMSVARALAQMAPPSEQTLQKNVMFMLFSGESFDYIGSDRFAYDMAEDKFPPRSVRKEDEDSAVVRPPHMHISDIEAYMELSQLALGDELFLHTDPLSRRNASVNQKVSELVTLLTNFSSRYGLSVSEPTGISKPLPPSSLHSLLKAHSALPGLVVADHNAAYTNSHYQSVYDTATAVGLHAGSGALLRRLTQVTQVVTSALYSLASGQQTVPDVTVDQTWLSSVLECYLERSNCSRFKTALDDQLTDKRVRELWSRDLPLPMYVSVAGQATRHYYLMELTQNLLAVEMGHQVAHNQDDCKAGNNKTFIYRWLLREFENGTREHFCSRSLVGSSLASSPAFEIDDYDWSSGAHPSWAESQWVEFDFRIFLQPSVGHDVVHLVVGILVTLLAVLLVSLLERRSHIVFITPRCPLLSAAGTDERRYGAVDGPVSS